MLQEKGLDATAAWAQQNGFSSVEFLQLPIDNWHRGVDSLPQAATIRKRLLDFGLTTACYSVGVNLLEGKSAIEFLKRNAELAAELGSPFLHHTLIDSLTLPSNAPSFAEVFPQILDTASEIARYCQSLGLTCLYEEQGLYFNGIEPFRRFFDEIKQRCPNVGICGDFGNILFADESPTTFFNTFLSDIKHVHIKDYQKASANDTPTVQDGWLQTKNGTYIKDVPLGEGIVDAAACLQILKKANYQGVFSLELVAPTVNNPSAMQLIKKLFI